MRKYENKGIQTILYDGKVINLDTLSKEELKVLLEKITGREEKLKAQLDNHFKKQYEEIEDER